MVISKSVEVFGFVSSSMETLLLLLASVCGSTSNTQPYTWHKVIFNSKTQTKLLIASQKLWWYSRSPLGSLALYLLTRKHYLGFQDPVAVWVLILNHTHAMHLDIFDSKTLTKILLASQSFNGVAKVHMSQSPYESLALCLLTRKHYLGL